MALFFQASALQLVLVSLPVQVLEIVVSQEVSKAKSRRVIEPALQLVLAQQLPLLFPLRLFHQYFVLLSALLPGSPLPAPSPVRLSARLLVLQEILLQAVLQ
jgi:hypothetical protein